MFPLWVLCASISGWIYPKILIPFNPFVTPTLALVMFAMGLTLSPRDFVDVLKNWRWVIAGFVAQYSIMPSLGYLLGVHIFSLPYDLAIGLMLVGCCPGGTASNLVSMIAKADVALSVMMTTASTIAAIVMTPLLISLSVKSMPSSMTVMGVATSTAAISVPDLISSVMNVVLLPVISGLIVNTKFPKTSSTIANTYAPPLSVVAVALICGAVSAAAKSSNLSIARTVPSSVMIKLALAITALHSLGEIYLRVLIALSRIIFCDDYLTSNASSSQGFCLDICLQRY